ncbi:hypothetical protein [Hespellia stercorisuis]|uniref:Uncharacterized protein n=1 Tax=Hespellia stercorisuis DSM 15480 TaxID=1121950 RepID=A0A1M6VYG0_9FIRM|nr:hypothetical protein [Hespellia stercorisuis]SHK86489.1 hypothetical protein SAMN02745243_03891 [Hespellia stercorisuis DSM 15480]
MTCTERIQRIRLLEKMKEQPEYSKKLGLEDVSQFHRNVKEEEKVLNDLTMWERQIGGR